MPGATLVIPPWIDAEFRRVAADRVESAAVLLVSVSGNSASGLRLLSRELHWVPDGAYQRREPNALTISSDGYVPALGRAAELKATGLWVHTHPGNRSSLDPSDRDRLVDRELASVFRLRSGSEFFGSVVLGIADENLSFTGYVGTEETTVKVTRMWMVGDRLRLTTAQDAEQQVAAPPMFDRNVRAFGGAVQRVLGELHCGLVGCGGTGSAVAEQLVRLGIRHFLLIDGDVLTHSNVTRVYGSTPEFVGQAKTEVLARHLRQIAPDASISVLPSMVTVEASARKLIDCDVIFGCTDDNAGRLILSRLASYYLVPVLDCGVVLTATGRNELTGIDGRVTVLSPGAACLVCRGRVDLQRAASEMLTPQERRRRVAEGYSAALPGVEPAVVSYTTIVAGVAVSELLERLIGYGLEPVPGEILFRFHDREISTNIAAPRPGHYCDPKAGKLGQGDSVPFLEQTWAV